MRQLAIAFVCLIGLTGCGQGDTYEAAMKRLIAEQKQLDRIDSSIKEIEDRLLQDEKKFEAKLNELKKTGASSEQGLKTNDQIIKFESGLLEAKREIATQEKAPWFKKLKEQHDRVEAARKAVDELTPK